MDSVIQFKPVATCLPGGRGSAGVVAGVNASAMRCSTSAGSSADVLRKFRQLIVDFYWLSSGRQSQSRVTGWPLQVDQR
jgi:hypothetical protein